MGDVNQSLFIEYINKYQRGIVAHIVETLNGRQDGAQPFFHRQMLRPMFSQSGMWETISMLNTRVSADFVAMDSSLPLKRRDAIHKASGEIVKSGMEMWMNERQLTELLTMVQLRSVQESDIIARLFVDTPRVITGIYELLERAFLQGLSTGVTEVTNSENVGTSLRMDYGYLTANKFGVSALWSNPATAKPLDDLHRVIRKAKDTDGNTVTDVWMDDVTFDRMIASGQVRAFVAWSMNYAGTAENVPAPSIEQLNNALRRDQRYHCTVHIIDRTVMVENAKGDRTAVKPWEEGKVILTVGSLVGILAYAQLAEMVSPVAGVTYQTADSYILVSRFSVNRPSLAEYTTSQARAVPVICNVESIYQLDATTIQA